MDLLKNEFNQEDYKDIPNYHRMTIIPHKFDKINLEPMTNSLPFPNIKQYKSKKIEGNFIKIDEKNNFELQKEDFKDFSENYNINRIQIYKKLSLILNKIFNKSCGTNINYNDDIFLISQNISKTISKIIKLDKVYIDKLVMDFIGKNNNNIHKGDVLILDEKMCDKIGSLLCYCYSESRIQQFKIKDMSKLVEIRKNILKKKINVFKDYLDYCKHNKPTDLSVTLFWKKQRNNYECLPELIFLFNRFSKVKEIVFDINSFKREEDSDLNEAHNLIVQLTLLNLNLISSSYKSYKINLIYEEFEKILYFKYYSDKYDCLCQNRNEIYKKNNPEDKSKIFHQKWNFKYSLDTSEDIKDNNITNKKSLPNDKEKTINKEGEKPLNLEKDNKESNISMKDNELNNIVENYMDKLELIIVCFYSLMSFDNYENLELTIIINDSFIQEMFILVSQYYSIEGINEIKDCLNYFDILLCNKKKIKRKLNLELNSLDFSSFEKALTFILKNKLLASLNISLFSSDVTYIAQSLYKIYLGEWNDDDLSKNDNTNYLCSDVIDIEKNILNKLSNNFIYHLSILLEILKYMGSLEEVGINIDIPPVLKNMGNYKNSILKFILNMIYLVSKNKNIKRFCLLSPKTILDSRKSPYINELLESVEMIEDSKLIDLTLNLQFVRITTIGKLISTQLQILNIGFLDFETFKTICHFLYDETFNKESCLKNISIGVSNTIINFDIELKFILRKLFSIKIKSLISLSLYTNIIIKDEIEYDYLLKILNNNWINEYKIVLNSQSNEFIKNYSNDTKNFIFFIPHSLEEKLLNPEDVYHYQKNSACLEIGKNLDKDDDSYWYLKYLFEHKYFDDLSNDYSNKNYIKGILKYLYFQKKPSIKLCTNSSFKKN